LSAWPKEERLMQLFYENPAEYPAIHGGDECGAGVRNAIPLHFPNFPDFQGGEVYIRASRK